MKIPSKIQIIDSARSLDSRMRFDTWEGYDPKLIQKHLAYKLNEIIEYLEALPVIPNEAPVKVEQQGDTVVHVHEWIKHMQTPTIMYMECRVCGETMSKII